MVVYSNGVPRTDGPWYGSPQVLIFQSSFAAGSMQTPVRGIRINYFFLDSTLDL